MRPLQSFLSHWTSFANLEIGAFDPLFSADVSALGVRDFAIHLDGQNVIIRFQSLDVGSLSVNGIYASRCRLSMTRIIPLPICLVVIVNRGSMQRLSQVLRLVKVDVYRLLYVLDQRWVLECTTVLVRRHLDRLELMVSRIYETSIVMVFLWCYVISFIWFQGISKFFKIISFKKTLIVGVTMTIAGCIVVQRILVERQFENGSSLSGHGLTLSGLPWNDIFDSSTLS